MFIIIPKNPEDRAYLRDNIPAPIAAEKDRGEIRILEIEGLELKNRPTIEEVDCDGGTEELAAQW